MASFEVHIEGLTQIDIGASTHPTTDELTEILQEGLVKLEGLHDYLESELDAFK